MASVPSFSKLIQHSGNQSQNSWLDSEKRGASFILFTSSNLFTFANKTS